MPATRSGMAGLVLLGAQALFSFAGITGPVRCGVPVPAEVQARGLGLLGRGSLQWRRLPVGDEGSDPIWIELAIDGARGTVRIVLGGVPASPGQRGPCFVRDREERATDFGREVVDRWAWRSGVVDERRRLLFLGPWTVGGETFRTGEGWTRASGRLVERVLAAARLPRSVWERGGVLPSGGRRMAGLRRHLRTVRASLREMSTLRGRGDFARSGGVITNLEFDTALALLRLGLCCGDEEALAQGLRAAVQQRDRDLDVRSGLPFVHGPTHRGGAVESGHCWLQGLFLAGLLLADDDMLSAGRAIAHALAARPPRGKGRFERARDYAWPLLELESLLAVDPDESLAAAADRLARSIDRRFDPVCATWRFGEGEVGRGIYLERAWITGGLVVVAMRRHLLRRPDPVIARHVEAVLRRLLSRIDSARGGLPIHWRCAGSRVFAEHRVESDPRALFLLEGIPPRDLRRLFGREEMRATTAAVPRLDDPDLATSFSMVARCSWIYR